MTAADVQGAVEGRLDELVDLFRRRLLDDRDKRRAFDALYARLEEAEAAARGEQHVPLIRDLLPLLDRLDRHALDGDAFIISLRDELLEILRRHGVREIEVGAMFDPGYHEAVGVEQPEADEPDDAIRAVVRRGFSLPHRVLRPAEVTVTRASGGPDRDPDVL